ncbi:hypothetical protein D3Z58_02730 [Clostridiaceae bacterium]|nr:hypothetical protein [Clostridiaceae bacterium]
MRKNVLCITIDGLSKWYIDQIKETNSFFYQLEKMSYYAENMYSAAPFTEGAVRQFWAQHHPLEGVSYLAENFFENRPFWEQFRQQGYYIYIGELIPFFKKQIASDNHIERENPEIRAFDHIWKKRLLYFIDLKRKNDFLSNDYKKIVFLLDCFFDDYSDVDYIFHQKQIYEKNKKSYIYDILENQEKSEFFKSMNKDLYLLCKNIRTNEIKAILKGDRKLIEKEFVIDAKYKNLNRLLKINKEFLCEDDIEFAIKGNGNRCVQSNNDLLFEMRESLEKLPKLEKELNDFLSWYDEYNKEIPFMAYIHNFDFHFPENFMNDCLRQDEAAYVEEIKERQRWLQEMPDKKMSVSKQLSVMNIEKCLEKFWKELERREVLKNTIVVLTADHGMTNYMYPLNRKSENRWDYTKMNFQIPFFVYESGITSYKEKRFLSTDKIWDFIRKENIKESDLKSYMVTFWINGIPDIDRAQICMGFRNNDYSITYKNYLSHVFNTKNILAVYDLKKDPDETYNLAGQEIEWLELEKNLEILKTEWFRMLKKIISNSNSLWTFSCKYSFINHDQKLFENLILNLPMISFDEFEEKLKDKKLILYGRTQRAINFLSTLKLQKKVEEIWEDHVSSESEFYMGHPVRKPHIVLENQTVIVIATKDEIYSLYVMKELNLSNYILESKIA